MAAITPLQRSSRNVRKPLPSQPTVREDIAAGTLERPSPATLGGLAVVAAVVLWAYAPTLHLLVQRWIHEPDYSHGFVVPLFSLYLLWSRRSMVGRMAGKGSWWGGALLLGAGGMRWLAEYLFYPLADAVSLIPCLAGLALLVGGWQCLAWSWPAITFLVFMMPLPGAVSTWLSHPLQRVTTLATTWLLQLFGVPAFSRGNIILLTHGEIGVVEACSGLRMIMLCLAITTAASFLIKRPLWEKLFVAASAVAIAIVTNILRVTVTALLHEYVSPQLAETLFHDLAGLFMMPVATLLLCLELYLLSKVLVAPDGAAPLMVSRPVQPAANPTRN